jgi:hypothetical protein
MERFDVVFKTRAAIFGGIVGLTTRLLVALFG